jgi:hypothetical protein
MEEKGEIEELDAALPSSLALVQPRASCKATACLRKDRENPQ